ncbi:MAG: ZIP family metal transporter [Halofilum sp. (in: g-proteobacteria)]|nr:ZIP family metal transporter [Halofilum sp. (in: g-proteobacteria)]
MPAAVAAVGILAGMAAIGALDAVLPHEHFHLGREGRRGGLAAPAIWLFVIAITIHNVPEGLAVGVGFGTGDYANGVALAIGIGLQNAPEGLAVAVALTAMGYSAVRAFWIASLTGLVEPVGGLLGAAAGRRIDDGAPWGLAFAAGAMLYVISRDRPGPTGVASGRRPRAGSASASS